MTDRELVMMLLKKISDKQEIVSNDRIYIEIKNHCMGENIAFVFDADEHLLSIEC